MCLRSSYNAKTKFSKVSIFYDVKNAPDNAGEANDALTKMEKLHQTMLPL